MHISIEEFREDSIKQISLSIEKNPEIFKIYNNSYNHMPELNPLRGEICKCLIYGLNISAITTTNLLVEHFLKIALIYKYSHEINKNQVSKNDLSLNQYYIEGHKKYNSYKLYDSIEEAFKKGIITEEEKDQLHLQRELLRNAYGHADKNKIFGDTKVSVQTVNFDDSVPVVKKSEMMNIVDLPFIQGLSLKDHAKINAFPYFKFVDYLIRKSLPKIFPDS